MQFLVLFDFTGRLHPAIVHLPIGILLLACLFELLVKNVHYPSFRTAIRAMIFWGMLSAIGSVVTGLLLEGSGEYEEEHVNPHKWTAFAVAAISVALYFLYRNNRSRKVLRTTSFILLAFIFITGHLGGNVTRGPEFLTEPFNDASNKIITVKPIPNIQQAAAFNDVVQPLLEEGCYSCHGPQKQKGKLRFDDKDAIIKGGKNGKTVVPGKPEESEMMKRMLLPLDHEDHMPPKNKPQLSKQQIAVLQWWVSTGADFNKKVSELKQPEGIKPALMALETGIAAPEEELTEVPEKNVAPADTAAIRKLYLSGVMVMPVALNSNYLSANFVTAASKADSLVSLLPGIKNQLISLKLDQSSVNDSSLAVIGSLTNLWRLRLSNTGITDQGLTRLKTLTQLRSLNLVGTPVTAQGVLQLKDLKDLKYLYLYKTRITDAEREELKKALPEVVIDFGNYSLPMLAGDTTEVDINVRQ